MLSTKYWNLASYFSETRWVVHSFVLSLLCAYHVLGPFISPSHINQIEAQVEVTLLNNNNWSHTYYVTITILSAGSEPIILPQCYLYSNVWTSVCVLVVGNEWREVLLPDILLQLSKRCGSSLSKPYGVFKLSNSGEQRNDMSL